MNTSLQTTFSSEFLNEEFCILIQISLMVVPGCAIDNNDVRHKAII